MCVLVLLCFGYVLHFGETAHETVHMIIIMCAAKIECNMVGNSVHLLGIFFITCYKHLIKVFVECQYIFMVTYVSNKDTHVLRLNVFV